MFNCHKVFAQLQRIRLLHREVLPTGKVRHRHIILYRGTVEFFHHRAADAASGTRRHFNKTVLQLAIFDIPQCGNAVFRAVDRQVGIAGGVLRHGLQDTTGGGENRAPLCSSASMVCSSATLADFSQAVSSS